MFDLETLDTKPSAVILSLGAVRFNPRGIGVEDTLLLKFDIDAQFTLGRTASDDTIEWWSKQAPEVQDEAFSTHDRTELLDAIEQFHKFVWNTERVWSQGSFDVNIMEDLYRSISKPIPWNYWQVRDSRTLFDFIDGNLDRSKHHDAMEDAKEQAMGVQRALHKIKWTGMKL